MSNDSPPTTRILSIPRGQSLALRAGNALVTRGLQDIAQFGNRARAKELVKLGRQHYYDFDDVQAIAYFTEAIRLDPNYASAFRDRGQLYEDRGDNEQAIADYTEAIRLDPKDVLAYFRRGRVYACTAVSTKPSPTSPK